MLVEKIHPIVLSDKQLQAVDAKKKSCKLKKSHLRHFDTRQSNHPIRLNRGSLKTFGCHKEKRTINNNETLQSLLD